jgi:hypothetical protein
MAIIDIRVRHGLQHDLFAATSSDTVITVVDLEEKFQNFENIRQSDIDRLSRYIEVAVDNWILALPYHDSDNFTRRQEDRKRSNDLNVVKIITRTSSAD